MIEAKSEVMIDDERVLGTRWVMPPGSQTGHHVHERHYLVLYLSDGRLTVETAEGEVIEADVTELELTSRPAGVSHNVMNRSADSVHFIEIELK